MPDLRIRLENDNLEGSTPPPTLDEHAAVTMLSEAEITASTLVPWGSNYTFAVGLKAPSDHHYLGIYKPEAGERPLWDFPTGTLHLREYASFRLSSWLGWDFVPPTVIRDGPHGPGSLQLYVEPGTEEIDESAFWGRRILPIERMVMFDHIANNADRKIGHCLVDGHGGIWGIDHGLTFNADPKLRTVLWQFAGQSVDPSIITDLRRLQEEDASIMAELAEILDVDEMDAFRYRIAQVVSTGCYPALDPRYNVPHGWW